jgi:hypothetical protein
MAKKRSTQKGLGQQLLDTMEDVIALMEDTNDIDRLKELNALRKEISRKAGELIEANLDSSTAEYKAATANLKNASNDIKKAIKGLESVKNAIASTAKALDLVAGLIGA